MAAAAVMSLTGSMAHRIYDFSKAPFLAIWEMTQACDLACVHCRATAQPDRSPDELDTTEAYALIDEVVRMGTPVMVFSGGDPLKRDDLYALIRHAKERGLRIGTIPAGTARLTPDVVVQLRDAGLDQMAVSLDATTAAVHDRFRHVVGAFDRTVQAMQWACDAKLPLQINTVIDVHNIDQIPALMAFVEAQEIVFWEVFFLVPTGRGASMQGLTAAQYERAFALFYELAQRAPFIIKLTEAPHYRRHLLQRYARDTGVSPIDLLAQDRWPPELGKMIGVTGRTDGQRQGVNAGKGFVFISHVGDVYPSGFLPVSAGNVRERSLAELYRHAPEMLRVRDTAQLQGRCGACEYRELCGGSRARAYAATGDMLADEPCCAYIPASMCS